MDGNENCPFVDEQENIATKFWRLNGTSLLIDGMSQPRSIELDKIEEIFGVENKPIIAFFSGKDTKVVSSAARIRDAEKNGHDLRSGHAIQNGKYIQLCTWKWTRHVGFRCLKNDTLNED